MMKKVIFLLNILILGASFEARAWNLSDAFYGYFWNKNRSKTEYALGGALFGGGVILSLLGINHLINSYKSTKNRVVKAEKMRQAGDKAKLVEENNRLRAWLALKSQMLCTLRKHEKLSYEGFPKLSMEHGYSALLKAKAEQKKLLAQFNKELHELAHPNKNI